MAGDPILAKIQQRLFDAGYYAGPVDGLWGPMSDAGITAALAAAGLQKALPAPPAAIPALTDVRPLAWGARVSPAFRTKVLTICHDLGVMPSYLMACMAWESGESFSPRIKNAAGSGATGLIQFMDATAKALGTSLDALAAMTAEDQLSYVYKYFAPYKGRLHSLSDVYMAILWPMGVGKPEDYVLFDQKDPQFPKRYVQNRGLDVNANGQVTKAEAAAKVQAKLDKGLSAGFAW